MRVTNKFSTISIIIPNYNRTTQLQRAVQSVLAQSYPHFELIIIDDASSIAPSPYLSKFQDQRIRLIRLEKNGGAARARNKAALQANGEYIAFLDSDDEWLPSFLEKRLELITANQADGIYGACLKYNEGKLIDIPLVHPFEMSKTMTNYLLSGTLRAVTSTLFYRKQAFLDIQFDPNLVPHEDYVLNIEFAKKYKYYCDSEPLTIYHANAGSLSYSIGDSAVKFLKKYGDELDYKWLFFFSMRKAAHALRTSERALIAEYQKILQKHLFKANLFWLFQVRIFSLIPFLYIRLFDKSVNFLYFIKKHYVRLFKN